MDGGQSLPERRTLPELISALTGDLATLVRKESELIRAELGVKLQGAARAAGKVAAGGLLMTAALLVLLQALVLALSKVMDPLWASLLVGGVVAAIGYGLVRLGMKSMDPKNLTPDRAARQLRKDVQMMKGR